MLGGNSWDEWIDRYSGSHQNAVNRFGHTIGIPLIVLSLPLSVASVFVGRLWPVPVTLFIVGWLFQFVGHAVEGKPPEFFHDWRFLLSASIAFGATVIVGLCGVLCQPLSGILSDHFGRKPVMLVPLSLLLLATLPCFALIAHYRNAAALYGATFILAGLLGLGSPASVTWLTESLPPHIRSRALSIVYAVSVSVFGGSTQFIAATLIERTGNPLAPAEYMSAIMGLGLVAMIATRESAPCKVGGDLNTAAEAEDRLSPIDLQRVP